MSHLRRDDDGRYRFPIADDVHEDGLRRNVVVPQIVMDDLKMPDDLAGRRSKCDDRVCILVWAETFPAVVVGIGPPVGKKTSPRAASTDITDQTFALPHCANCRPPMWNAPDTVSRVGIGSQLQRSVPLFASYAPTTPRSRSTARLSPIDEPTMTRSPITAGGDVT